MGRCGPENSGPVTGWSITVSVALVVAGARDELVLALVEVGDERAVAVVVAVEPLDVDRLAVDRQRDLVVRRHR